MINDEELEDIEQFILEECEEYLYENVLESKNPDFRKIMNYEISDIVMREGLQEEWCSLNDLQEIQEWVYDIMDFCFEEHQFPNRSDFDGTPISPLTQESKEHIENIILEISKNESQHEQRSLEWHKLRYNLFSASSIWKLFNSQAQFNSLIYEKCKPCIENQNRNNTYNCADARNWGVKYEPVSVQLYEDLFRTKIKHDYGCVVHPKYPFIGASPDGINTDPESDRFGRMIEIKNIVNREINGIPLEEYWIQMQIQMETCNLNECDFLETRFKEYENESQFYQDDIREYRGVILYLLSRIDHSVSIFKYMPFYVKLEPYYIKSWITQIQHELNQEYILYDTIYWYLDEYSCVLVKRNTLWFEHALPIIEKAYTILETERKEGFEHRAPKKKKNNTLKLNDHIEDSQAQSQLQEQQLKKVIVLKLDENGEIM